MGNEERYLAFVVLKIVYNQIIGLSAYGTTIKITKVTTSLARMQQGII